MVKLKSDSTSTIKGFLFQFLVALEKCFEMRQGESVYIETYGDVSIIGDLSNSKQIESKLYKKDLTDLDKNVWKSIYNWMNKDFKIEDFSSLVLFTTQKVSSKSAWLNWNNKHFKARKDTLLGIKNIFDTQKRKSKDLTKYMNTIFATENAGRLLKIVEKLYIDSVNMDGYSYYKYLQQKYGKNIPDIQKEKYITHLFGYILNPNIVNQNWKITYEDFNKEAQEITKTLIENTTVFPEKLKLSDIHIEDYEKNVFVEKIKDIQYEEVIPDAIDDYVHTASIIQQELEISEVKLASLLTYEDNVRRNYNTKYRKASRNYHKGERIAKSQDFYDDITSANDGTFHIYNDVPTYFHNGILHILVDENPELKWLLKQK